MNNLDSRIAALEKHMGTGVFGKIATEIIHSKSVTEGVLTAFGEIWERRQGESDDDLRQRAVDETLKNNERVLMGKVTLEYIKKMYEVTCPGKAYRIERGKVKEVPCEYIEAN
ncbi:MAG: hypothetical protein H8D87_19445 [Deltaproteobacteria bacterium]|nr:hypothetical protein [Candidatus Desulfobacula maris]